MLEPGNVNQNPCLMEILMLYLRLDILVACPFPEMYLLYKKFLFASCVSYMLFWLPQEEEALMAAHRKEIEDTMEIVREVSEKLIS